MERMERVLHAAPKSEEKRAQTLCGNPSCWRRLCQQIEISLNFCCYACESGYCGRPLDQQHGPACTRKHQPNWETALRAPAEPTPGWDPGTAGGRRRQKTAAHAQEQPRRGAATRARPTEDSDGDDGPDLASLFREVASSVLVSEDLQKSVVKFLQKCYQGAKAEAQAKGNASHQASTFVESWASDVLWRYSQSVGNFSKSGLSARNTQRLFVELCRQGALPARFRRRSDDFSWVPGVVQDAFDEVTQDDGGWAAAKPAKRRRQEEPPPPTRQRASGAAAPPAASRRRGQQARRQSTQGSVRAAAAVPVPQSEGSYSYSEEEEPVKQGGHPGCDTASACQGNPNMELFELNDDFKGIFCAACVGILQAHSQKAAGAM